MCRTGPFRDLSVISPEHVFEVQSQRPGAVAGNAWLWQVGSDDGGALIALLSTYLDNNASEQEILLRLRRSMTRNCRNRRTSQTATVAGHLVLHL